MSDSDINSPRRTRARAKQTENIVGKTPSKCLTIATSNVVSPSRTEGAENAKGPPPRRSARKSYKPMFDYNEIVNAGSASKQKTVDNSRWQPAEVGRTSEKRGRKKRIKTKLAEEDEENAATSKTDEETSKEAEEKLNEELKRVNLPENEIVDISNNKIKHVVPTFIYTSPSPEAKSPKENAKPAKNSKTPRLPTPYKPRKVVKQQAENLDTSVFDEIDPIIVDMPLEQFVQRSIRKRSLSISVDVSGLPAAKKTRIRVTFYIPANQTKVINESEEELEEEQMKENIEKADEPSFITKRRRRSKSFDETITRKPG